MLLFWRTSYAQGKTMVKRRTVIFSLSNINPSIWIIQFDLWIFYISCYSSIVSGFTIGYLHFFHRFDSPVLLVNCWWAKSRTFASNEQLRTTSGEEHALWPPIPSESIPLVAGASNLSMNEQINAEWFAFLSFSELAYKYSNFDQSQAAERIIQTLMIWKEPQIQKSVEICNQSECQSIKVQLRSKERIRRTVERARVAHRLISPGALLKKEVENVEEENRRGHINGRVVLTIVRRGGGGKGCVFDTRARVSVLRTPAPGYFCSISTISP